MIETLTTRHAYVAFTALLCIGIYMMIANKNLVKKIIGLNLFQTAVFLLFIASAYVEDGKTPIVHGNEAETELFVSPLPHVLVLTAIVVGVSLTAVGLALCLRLYTEYGTLRTDALREALRNDDVLPGDAAAEPSAGDGADAAEPSTGDGADAATDGGDPR